MSDGSDPTPDTSTTEVVEDPFVDGDAPYPPVSEPEVGTESAAASWSFDPGPDLVSCGVAPQLARFAGVTV